MNGLEVLEALQEQRRELPIIMLSSQSAMKTFMECVKLGAVAYILKHSPPVEAQKRSNEALDGLAAAAEGAQGGVEKTQLAQGVGETDAPTWLFQSAPGRAQVGRNPADYHGCEFV
jgi:DNA-binding NarL/FixJ family response regulator